MRTDWMNKHMMKYVITAALLMGLPLAAGAMQWPDTSQDKCYNNTQVIPCPTSNTVDFHGQDAQFQSPAKSYTKLGENGEALPDSATSWVTVRDNVTGLIWEVKTNKDGAADYTNPHDANNIYTWCDSGGAYPGTCGTQDSEDFLEALNSISFGGYSDWRLPTVQELSSLLYIATPPLVDWNYFPATIAQTESYDAGATTYWASDVPKFNTNVRFGVGFYFGRVRSPTNGNFGTGNVHPVRAVRDPQ